MAFGFFNKEHNGTITERRYSPDNYMADNRDEPEHYDGTAFKALYPERPITDWDHSRGSVKNIATRLYLQQVRECKRAIQLLERRKEYRAGAGQTADDLDAELDAAKEKLNSLISEIADEISRIGNVGEEMVLTMRYIDTKTWDEIAEAMDIRISTVLKFHGNGLVNMRGVLLEDGLIDEDND